MTAFFAFLHHVAAFTLVATLAVEFVLLRGELTVKTARTLLSVDSVYGMSAGVILIVGFLRVFYFEKGSSYYFHSIPFIAKLTLFAIVGLISIYPTVQFLSWRTSIRNDTVPMVEAGKLKKLRAVLHWELALIVLILLCAALMARGIGYLGA